MQINFDDIKDNVDKEFSNINKEKTLSKEWSFACLNT